MMAVSTLGELAALLEAHGCTAGVFHDSMLWTVRFGHVQVSHKSLAAALTVATAALDSMPCPFAEDGAINPARRSRTPMRTVSIMPWTATATEEA